MIDPKRHPFDLFRGWLAEATEREPDVPTAVALATVDERGAPSVRMVLLKALDERGFVFYTNLGSPKARNLTRNPRGALCFHWKSLKRQVRAEGEVEAASEAEADAYFATRAREAQLGAWASRQSEPLGDRRELLDRVAAMGERFPGEVPRPPHWGGFRLMPDRVEFWLDGEARLHDRFAFRSTGDGWLGSWMYP